MYRTDNATRPHGVALPRRSRPAAPGLLLGSVGVLAFSFSFPATKLAVADLDPWLVAFGRAAVAGVLALLVLAATRAPRPSARQWRALALVAGGVVVGFPLMTSLALQRVPSGHGAVVIAVLPALTAAFAVLRAGEREPLRFWLAAAAGLLVVLGFTAGRGAGCLAPADAYLLIGVLLCAAGYAEGGTLARELGGASTICWALVLALPVCTPVTVLVAASTGLHAQPTAWLGFAYVAVISMFLGFFAWYAGLARGGVARIGQLQLAQPVLSLMWAALVLGERVGAAEMITANLVLSCVVATQRARA